MKIPRTPNSTLLKCSACGASLKERPAGIAWWIDQILWQVFAWVTIWRVRAPFVWGFLAACVLAVPWNAASRRLYASYWHWRHPLRCETRGHAEPLPEGSS